MTRLALLLLWPAAAAAADGLSSRLLERVSLRPDADPRAGAVLRGAVESVLGTPTGRRLAEAFVAEGHAASIGFAEVKASRLVEGDNGRAVSGSGGFTVHRGAEGSVSINRSFIAADEGSRRSELARVLAHELFGHALARARAERAGVSEAVYTRFRGDEANASMVGWLVQAESGGRLDNELMWVYLEDREKFYGRVRFQTGPYAESLSRAQMRDPQSAWRAGLEAARSEARRLSEMDRRDAHWAKVVVHFATEHALARGRFRAVEGEIRGRREVFWPALRADLAQSEAQLRGRVAAASTEEGRRLIAELGAAADSACLVELDRGLLQDERRLRALVGRRERAAEQAPAAGQVSWAELERMWSADDPAHRARLPWRER